jgi:hypothetical protein
MYVSGQHTKDSHADSRRAARGLLSVKQRAAVEAAVKYQPLMVGSQVHANLKNFSPGKHVPSDKRSTAAVDRLVRKERKVLMADRIPGIIVDGSNGAMVKLAQSISLARFIKKHNDPTDQYHLDEHQVFCLGFQFKDGVIFMVLANIHMLLNLARLQNTGWQRQVHWDGAFNWCTKDFGIIAVGCNSMGAHFNLVSLSIVTSESGDAIEHSWDATTKAVFSLFKSVTLCDREECGCCEMIREQARMPRMRELLRSENGARDHFPVDKPSSDHTKQFFSFAKKKFGADTKVQQCGQHASGI